MELEGTEEACAYMPSAWCCVVPVNQLAGAGQERQLPGGLSLGHCPHQISIPHCRLRARATGHPLKRKCVLCLSMFKRVGAEPQI